MNSNKYPLSDHYNGETFHNPGLQTDKSFWKVIKWMFARPDAQYPDFIENKFQPELAKNLEEKKIALTFINHASFLVQTKNFNYLTDPVFSERVSPVSFLGPKRIRKPGIEISELPQIDFILISHNHYDHMDIDSLKILNKKFNPVFVVPLGNSDYLTDLKNAKIIELDWWQSYIFKSSNESIAEITLTPAQHWSGRSLSDRRKALWGGFAVNADQTKVFFSGDSGYSETLYKSIGEKFKSFDLALLPVGAYQPRDFMKEQHMNPEEAVKTHLDIFSKQSIGMHFGCFRLSDELWGQSESDLEKSKKTYNVEKFNVLEVGQTQVF